MEDEYFDFGPQNPLGTYAEKRGSLDGLLGVFDGISSIANSGARTVGSIADARAAWAQGQSAADQPQFDRETHEQDLLLEAAGHERGDNVQMYYVLGAIAVAVIVLFK